MLCPYSLRETRAGEAYVNRLPRLDQRKADCLGLRKRNVPLEHTFGLEYR